MPHDGHRHGEHVGELEVVEADDRRLVRRGAQGAQGADRVAVVGGEERGRSAVGREREQLAHRGLGRGRVVGARADERVVGRDAGVAQRGAVAVEALAGREADGRVADEGDPSVPVGEQVLDGRARPADVVEQHGVGGDAARRTVQEDDRRARGQLAEQAAKVAAGRDDQQGVDRAAQEPQDEPALALGILVARARDEDVAVGVGGVLDRAGDLE